MENDIEKLELEYQTFKEKAEAFCSEIRRSIEKELENNGIELGFPIISRVKTWDSIKEKLGRLKKEFTSLTDMQDLIGTRIILLFPSDVGKVCEILDKIFKDVRKYDTIDRLKEDQFGYASIHYIVRVPSTWFETPAFKGLPNFQTEVQIRTLSQHLWAEASHILQYKNEESVPIQFLRDIYRVSALLEIVDAEIDRALHLREQYRNDFQTTTNLNKNLNSDSLEIILSEEFPDHKDNNEFYSDLVSELKFCGIDTHKKFMAFIHHYKDDLLFEDKKIVKQKLKKKKYLSENEKKRVQEKNVYYTHTGLVRNALDKEFEGSWRESL